MTPPRYLGLTGGIFNLCATLAGIVTPMVIGWFVASTGSFAGALIFVGATALMGVVTYVFVLAPIKPVELAVT